MKLKLDERNKRILQAYRTGQFTQVEIEKLLKLPRGRVWQILKAHHVK